MRKMSMLFGCFAEILPKVVPKSIPINTPKKRSSAFGVFPKNSFWARARADGAHPAAPRARLKARSSLLTSSEGPRPSTLPQPGAALAASPWPFFFSSSQDLWLVSAERSAAANQPALFHGTIARSTHLTWEIKSAKRNRKNQQFEIFEFLSQIGKNRVPRALNKPPWEAIFGSPNARLVPKWPPARENWKKAKVS